MLRAFITLSLGCFSLATTQEIFLDDVMSASDQQKTGVATLSVSQKIALEAWLNEHCMIKTQSTKPVTTLSLSINIDNGQKLQLSDNSLWIVAPEDVRRASVWITPFPIQITASNDANYPSLLTNMTSGESIKAKRWVSPNSTPHNTP